MQVSKNEVNPRELKLQRRNAKSLFVLGVMVFSMVGLAYASVPLYDLFCRVTGFGGTTQVAEQSSETIINEHDVKVRFNAHINPELDLSLIHI